MAAKYRGIANDLRSRVQNGEWSLGDPLPSEDKLAAHYRVARMTLRKALGALINEGMLESRHGTGNFVIDPQPPVRISRLVELGKVRRPMSDDNFLADAEEKDFAPVTAEEIWFGNADEDIAAVLEIPLDTEICRRERVVRTRGEAVQSTTAYLPREVTRDTAIEHKGLGEKDLYKILEKAGHRPLKFRETVRCRLLTEDEKQKMDNFEGLAMAVVRTARTGERPVAVHYVLMTPRRCELNYEWES